MVVDTASCIVTGGSFLRTRVESAAACYDASSAVYFENILNKTGEGFCDSASGFLLLDNLLLKNKIDRSEIIILTDKNNRPRICGENIDFSVSHSEGCAFCAVALGEGANIGCDVQRVRDYSQKKMAELSKAFMSDGELAEFEKSGFGADRFFTAWTRREAYVKRIGSDIFDMLKTDVPENERFLDGVIYACGEKYRYSVSCGENIQEQPE